MMIVSKEILQEEKDANIEMIQFHQSYSYEDFIQGYRPSKDGFELVNGAFYKFCKEAEEDNERPEASSLSHQNLKRCEHLLYQLF